MKWPWVSREHHEESRALIQAALADATAARDRAEAFIEEHLRDALARYHVLKLQGYAEPPAPVVITRAAPDPVKQAIANAAGTDRALRMQMERQAAVDAAAGVSREEIALRIAKGTSVDESFGVSA